MTSTEPTAPPQHAGTELAELPRCAGCGAQLVLRGGFDGTGNGHTVGQRSQGIWYDHPVAAGSLIGHTSSVLLTRGGGF